MQAFELTILNWIQAHLRCGVLDAVMVPVSRICDHGEVWILLAAILVGVTVLLQPCSQAAHRTDAALRRQPRRFPADPAPH